MRAMDILKSWLTAEYGRAGRMAKHLCVPASFVSAMADGRKPVPVGHGAAIEQFTAGQVRRQDLFPDCWQRIWPELAAQETAPDTSASTHQPQPEAATANS